jgi:hypothetical protein
MNSFVVLAGLACLIALILGGTRSAFRDVYLTSLLILPSYFDWTQRPLPSLDFTQMALVPLLFGMILFDLPRWRLSAKDLWMLLFIMSSCYAQYESGQTSASILTLFGVLAVGLVPYMAGKLLIEVPGGRTAFCRRYVWLVVLIFLPSAVEYITKTNVMCHLWNHIFQDQYCLTTQVRWGFGRVSGPYLRSEIAGTMVSTGLFLSLWLVRPANQDSMPGTLRSSIYKHRKLVVAVMLAFLWVTQARGPWIGTVLGLCIAYIGYAANPRRRAVLVIGALLVIGVPTYTWGKDYSSGPRTDYGSERETAQYRSELIQNYVPLAEAGGLWGWGPKFPVLDGQASIDNEYLLTYVTQGSVGFLSLLLLLGQTLVVLTRAGFRARSASDRHFIFTLLGAIVAFAFALATVAMHYFITFELFFLLMGWADSIKLTDRPAPMLSEQKSEKRLQASSRVRVYT